MVTQMMIEKAKEGDASAFEQIYNETIKGAYYVARKFLGTDTAVEDVLQESYIKVYEKLGEYQAGNFQGWVDVIVANRCKDYLKKKNPLLFSEMESDDGVEFDKEDTREEFRPDAKVDYDETKRLVKEIIDKLPIDQKMSVVMFYYEQMSVKEIATAMECSENTIKSRLNYGRKTIKAEVEKLEKRGTKLYCAPILPFLLWMFKEEAKACELPVGLASGNVIANLAIETGKASAKANLASATAAKVGLSIGAKIGIGAAAAVVVAGGIGAAVFFGSNQKEEPIGIPTTDYVETNEVEEESEVAESEPEEINVDQIVKDFMENYDGNQYIDTLDGNTIVNEESKYVYYWQGDVPVIIVENVDRRIDGSVDDLCVYTLFTVDTTTGEVNGIAYSGTALEVSVVGCDIYTGVNDAIVQNFDSMWNDTGLDTYYQFSINKTTVKEKELSADEGVNKTSGSEYALAEWIYLGEEWEEPAVNNQENTSDYEEWDRWSNAEEYADENPLLQGDCPLYCEYFSEIFYLPCSEAVFTDNGWVRGNIGYNGWTCYTNSDFPGYELYLQYQDQDKGIINGLKMNVYNLENPPFNLCIGGVNFSSDYEQIKITLGEPTSESVYDDGHIVAYKKDGMNFGARTYVDANSGKEYVKYMEIIYNP